MPLLVGAASGVAFPDLRVLLDDHRLVTDSNLLDETSGPTWIPDHATRVFYEVREIYAVSDASIGKVETRARIQSQEVEV